MPIQAIVTGNVATQNYLAGAQPAMVVGVFKVTSPALLGTADLTFQWTKNGVINFHVESLLLTALGNVRPFCFRAEPDTGIPLTWTVAVGGLSGGFSAQLSAGEMPPY